MKKNVKRKFFKYVTVGALLLALGSGIVLNSVDFKSKASEDNKECDVQEGINNIYSFKDENSEESKVSSIEINQLEDGTIQAIVVDKDGKKNIGSLDENSVNITRYDSSDNIVEEKEIDVEELLSVENQENIEEEYDEDVTRGGVIKWQKKIKDGYTKTYWYKKGVDNDNHEYYKIGKNDNIRLIDMNMLNNEEIEKVNYYASLVKKCKDKKAIAQLIHIAGSTAVATGILIASLLDGVPDAAKLVVDGVAAVAKFYNWLVGSEPITMVVAKKIVSLADSFEQIEDAYYEICEYGEILNSDC